ncbi:MAG: helix-turn-helix transcriptional regulator [Edaphobacter sp.]
MAKPIGAYVNRKSSTPNEVFGRAVTALRSKRKVSQVLLSESLGYSSYYLGRIERGHANVSCDVMAAVSEYFGMTIGQFWAYAERLAKTPFSPK